MKIRGDFVTNSSSSSFILIGKRVYANEVNIDSGKRYVAVGKWLCEGEDFIYLNKELFELVKQQYCFFNLFEVELIIDEGRNNIELNGKYDIHCVNADYHSTDNVVTFKERYGQERYGDCNEN